jgi:hypothetical protein
MGWVYPGLTGTDGTPVAFLFPLLGIREKMGMMTRTDINLIRGILIPIGLIT